MSITLFHVTKNDLVRLQYIVHIDTVDLVAWLQLTDGKFKKK